jgi:hypothetical protein
MSVKDNLAHVLAVLYQISCIYTREVMKTGIKTEFHMLYTIITLRDRMVKEMFYQ